MTIRMRFYKPLVFPFALAALVFAALVLALFEFAELAFALFEFRVLLVLEELLLALIETGVVIVRC